MLAGPRRGPSRLTLTSLMCAAALVTFASSASAAEYQVVDLGTLGGTSSVARHINDAGQVVGNSTTAMGVSDAFIWSQATGMQNLNEVAPDTVYLGPSINAGGQVALSGPNPNETLTIGLSAHPYSYSRGVATDLGSVFDPGCPNAPGCDPPTDNAFANAINDSGVVVGSSTTTASHAGAGLLDLYPAIWTGGPGSGVGLLPNVHGQNGAADAISNSGEIVGRVGGRAALWPNSGAAPTALGLLSGSTGTRSNAYAINSAGTVVGQSDVAPSTPQAFIWTQASGMQPLGVLPGGKISEALDINSAGAVVGDSDTGPDTHGFIWRSGTLTDLNTLIDPGSGWDLQVAHGINTRGQIVGTGTHNGQTHAFLLEPLCTVSAARDAAHARDKAHAAALSSCDPDGLDWRMPPRLDQEVKAWSGSEGIVPQELVYPSKWHTELFLTKGGTKLTACRPNTTWKWTVAPPRGAKVLRAPRDGCSTAMDVSALGTYVVTATKYVRQGAGFVRTTAQLSHRVVVKDWLLVGMGDSNGSGEGNPPFAFDQCSRSLTSYQFQAAKYVELHNSHASVTFVFASCSGAVISDLYKTEFAGALHPTFRRLPPQIEQVARVIKRPFSFGGGPPQRKVDAAIISIGVNNLGFGPLLSYCVFNLSLVDPCERKFVMVVRDHRGAVDHFESSLGRGSKTLEAWIEQFVHQLPARYGPLARALSNPLSTASGHLGLGLPPDGVQITQYPDFTRGTTGQLCSGRIGPQSTWGTLELDAASLNGAVARGAREHGWNVVPLSQDLFTGPPVGHGYCASDSYFRGIAAAVHAGDQPGAFHPNAAGHHITALATIKVLCKRLYGNPTCGGEPR